MARVGIVGTGKLGTRLAELLVVEQGIDILLLDNRSKLKLAGTIQSLELWKEFIQANCNIDRINSKNISELDLIIVAIKDAYDPRILIQESAYPDWLPADLRCVGITRDIHLLRDVAQFLRGYQGIVLVVTNPVDVVATLLQRWLPTARVLGAGISLDAARMACVCARRLGGTWSDYPCALAGEHGREVVPLVSLWKKLMPESVVEQVIDNYAGFVAEALGLGIRIVEDLGYTLQDSAEVIRQDITWLLAMSETTGFRCFSTVVTDTLCTAWPLRFEAGQLVATVDCLAADERLAIEKSKKSIGEILGGIERDYPDLIRP